MFLKLISSKLCSSKVIKWKPFTEGQPQLCSSEQRPFCNSTESPPILISSASSSASTKNSSFDAGRAVSLLSIKKAIKSFGEVSDGFCCLRTVCPACVTNNKTNPNIYINKITGTVVCPSCQIVRSWSVMEKFFMPTPAKHAKDMETQRNAFDKAKEPVRKHLLGLPKTAKSISKLSKDEIARLTSWLGFETLNVTVFENLKSMYDEPSGSIFFPMLDVDGIIVGYKRLTKENDLIVENAIPDVNCFGVITLEAVSTKASREAPSAILVLNVLDLLALSTQKLSSSVVCLPHGFQSLPQECLPALERFQRLILWFHYDAVGWDTARNFSSKLDEKRCVFVRPTDNTPSPFVAHSERLDIKAILATAQPILHKAITTFRSLRQDVLSELQNIEKVQGVKWQRYPILNKLLKGHRRGELTVLTGPTGCGKTTFMSEYSLDLALQGVTTLWGSFEIRNTRLASTLLRQLAGHPLFDERLGDFDRWADEFEHLPIYFMTFYGQQTIKVVMETIEHAQYVHDIQHVIIDNVQFMMGTADEPKHIDRFWRQDAIIAAFRTFATKRNCHVTLVIHPRKERDAEDLTTSSIFGSAKATQEADTVLIIQDKRLTAIRGKKYLQVAKNRYSGDLGIMPLDFDKEGLSYATKRKKTEERSEEAISS